MVECPVCGIQVSENEIESHVNKCLEQSNDIAISEDLKIEEENSNFDGIYECENCHTWAPINDIYIQDCGHKVCHGCVGNLMSSFLEKKSTKEPSCPSCNSNFTDNDATCLLDAEKYRIWQKNTYKNLIELRKNPTTTCNNCKKVKKSKKPLQLIPDINDQNTRENFLNDGVSVSNILFQIEATSSISCGSCGNNICVACGKDSGGEFVHLPIFCPILFSVVIGEAFDCLDSLFFSYYQIALIPKEQEKNQKNNNNNNNGGANRTVSPPKKKIGGIGFDGSANEKYSGIDAAHQKENRNRTIISNLLGLIANLLPSNSGYSPHSSLFSLIEHSCLIPLLVYYFRNDWLMDMQSQENELYFAVLKVLRALASHPGLVGILLLPTSKETTATLFDSIKKLNKQASFVMKQSSAFESQGGDNAMNILGLALDIQNITAEIENSIEEWKGSKFASFYIQNDEKKEEIVISNSEKQKKSGFFGLFRKKEPEKITVPEVKYDYIAIMKELQFEFMSPYPKSLQSVVYTHEFQSLLTRSNISPDVMIRLSQELSSLAGSLPLSETSGIFMRVDEENINFIRFIIIGPEDTPYANGCFEFEMIIGNNYPQKPPGVQLMTTGNGTVRFNPNLYNTGKVCLSLLGTWSGPGWDPKVSTLLQVLVSIQSLILVPDPYFNEPGYESEMGTANGNAKSKSYNANICYQNVQWAMIDQLKRPTPGFEDVIRNHFFLKKNSILQQVEQWSKDFSPSCGNFSNLLEQLRSHLNELKGPILRE